MICVYDRKETDFEHNGLAILDNCIRCEVEEELNGFYGLELEYSIFDKKAKYLVEDNIIKAPTPNGLQLFRIYRKVKNMSIITVYARHIFYDLLDNFIEDCRPKDTTGINALDWLLTHAQYNHKFKCTGDVGGTKTKYFVRKNLVESIFEIVDFWGGELVRDNYIIKLLNSRGTDNNISIRYGKNLIGIEEEIDMDSVATRIMPQGFDGLFIPEKYIDSPIIKKYPHPRIRKIKFENIKAIKEGAEEQEEGAIPLNQALDKLRIETKKLYENEHIDIPQVNYIVNFVELTKTEEYKDYKILETTNIGDTVTVKHKKLDIDIKAKCIKYKWDSITNKYIEIELGNFKDNICKDISNTINNISDEIINNKSNLEKAIDNATKLLTNALGGYVVKRNGEILIMDTEDVNTATKVWRWNLAGLGYSRTGVNGRYALAMTMDGAIVADFLTSGTLDANIIKTGTLTSKTGKIRIDLNDDTLNVGNKLIFDGDKLKFADDVTLEWNNIEGKPNLDNYLTEDTLTTKLGQDYVVTGKILANQITGGSIEGVNIKTSTNDYNSRIEMTTNGVLKFYGMEGYNPTTIQPNPDIGINISGGSVDIYSSLNVNNSPVLTANNWGNYISMPYIAGYGYACSPSSSGIFMQIGSLYFEHATDDRCILHVDSRNYVSIASSVCTWSSY